MKFLEKNACFHRLKGNCSEFDKALLVKFNSGHKVLSSKYFDKEKENKEILYALLDYATEEEITANRNGKTIVVKQDGSKIEIEKKKSRHKPRKRK